MHDIEIRDLRTQAEYAACVELQQVTWGPGFREAVPATILKISQRVGGVTAGAFDTGDDALLGFVFGITGVEQGAIVHWSDMLAVRPDVQGRGLGRALKRHQHDAVAAIGATRMYWTYDPLVARNAYFNLERLGARVAEYVPDMYGRDTGSPLHRGVGTDRLVVIWPIGEWPPREAPGTTPASPDAAPVLNAAPGVLIPGLASLLRGHPPMVRIAIPADIHAERARSEERAAAWRASTREAFTRAFAEGYTVTRFEPGLAGAPGHYWLMRG